MSWLVLEASTEHPQAGVWREGELVSVADWTIRRRHPSPLFDRVAEVLEEAGESLASLQGVVVGRGPGNYSGIRMALCAAHGFMLPHRGRVIGVASGEALAARMLREGVAKRVGVMGDARRGCVWMGQYRQTEDEGVVCLRDWSLVPYAEAPEAMVAAGGVWCSPDADRLVEVHTALPQEVWLGEGRPTVADVGRRAAAIGWQDLAGSGTGPIYLHPPVQ